MKWVFLVPVVACVLTGCAHRYSGMDSAAPTIGSSSRYATLDSFAIGSWRGDIAHDLSTLPSDSEELMMSVPEEITLAPDKTFLFYRGNTVAKGWWRVDGPVVRLTIRDIDGVDTIDVREKYEAYMAAKPEQKKMLPSWWVSEFLTLKLLERADTLALYSDGKSLYETDSTTAPDGSKLSGTPVWRRAKSDS